MFAGQAVVQMAHHPKHRMEVAIKFFITKSAFLLEKTLYTTDSLLGQFLPQACSSLSPFTLFCVMYIFAWFRRARRTGPHPSRSTAA